MTKLQTLVPLEWVKPCRLCDVTGNALVFVGDFASSPILVVQNQGDAAGVYLGSQWSFEIADASALAQLAGAALLDIEFELDLGSIAPAFSSETKAGGIMLQDGSAYLLASDSRRPFLRPMSIPLQGDLNALSKHERLVFARWAITKRMGKSRRVLWSAPTDASLSSYS